MGLGGVQRQLNSGPVVRLDAPDQRPRRRRAGVITGI